MSRWDRFKRFVKGVKDAIVFIFTRGSGVLLCVALLGCPKPIPTPTPTPPPTPPDCCADVNFDASLWSEVKPTPAAYNGQFVSAAEAAVGDVCGAVPIASLDRLAAQLRSMNLCAGRGADAVMILRPDGMWEEWHAVAYTDGCWTSITRAYIGAWLLTDAIGGRPGAPCAEVK